MKTRRNALLVSCNLKKKKKIIVPINTNSNQPNYLNKKKKKTPNYLFFSIQNLLRRYLSY